MAARTDSVPLPPGEPVPGRNSWRTSAGPPGRWCPPPLAAGGISWDGGIDWPGMAAAAAALPAGASAAAAGAVAASAAAGASAGATEAAVDTSSAVVTRRCTSACMPPASGTRRGMPMLRTAALTSAATHHTSCSQASHTTTEQARSTAEASSRWVSRDADGMVCGIGRPNTVIRATGGPASSTSSTTMAPRPAGTSHPERARPGLRSCLAISTALLG